MIEVIFGDRNDGDIFGALAGPSFKISDDLCQNLEILAEIIHIIMIFEAPETFVSKTWIAQCLGMCHESRVISKEHENHSKCLE